MTSVQYESTSHAANLYTVADTVRSATGVDIALFGLTLPDRGARILSVSGARHPERFLGLEIPPGRGITGKALTELRPISTNDYLRDHTFVHSDQYDRINAAESVVTKAVCPVFHPPFNKSVFGVVIVANRAARPIDVTKLISAANSIATPSVVHCIPINLLLDHVNYIFIRSISRSWNFSQIQASCARVGVEIMKVDNVALNVRTDQLQYQFIKEHANYQNDVPVNYMTTSSGTFLQAYSEWFIVRYETPNMMERLLVERSVCGLLAMWLTHYGRDDSSGVDDELISGHLVLFRAWEKDIPSAPDPRFVFALSTSFIQHGIGVKVYKASAGIYMLLSSDNIALIKRLIYGTVSVCNKGEGGAIDGVWLGSYCGAETQLLRAMDIVSNGLPKQDGIVDLQLCPGEAAKWLIKSEILILIKNRWMNVLRAVSTQRLKVWTESLGSLLKHSSLRKAAASIGIPESSLRARIHVVEKLLGIHIIGCGAIDLETLLTTIREEIDRRDKSATR